MYLVWNKIIVKQISLIIFAHIEALSSRKTRLLMYPIKSSGFWFGNPLVIKKKNCEINNDKKVCMDAGTSVEGVIGNSTRKNIWWNTWGRLTIRFMNLRVAFATNTADLLIPSVNTSLVYLQPLYIYSLTL